MTALLKYDRARQLLAEARNVDEVMNLRDQSRMMREYARIANDPQLEIDAATLRVYSERRLGEMLIAGKKSGQISPGQPKKNASSGEGFSRITLEKQGISHKLSHRAQKRAVFAPKAFDTLVNTMRARMKQGERISFDKVVKETSMQKARAAHEKKTYEGGRVDDLQRLAADGHKFGAIYADPAWKFESWGQDGQDRAAGNHYTLTTLDDMKAMPVEALAAEDCALFMWVSDPMLPHALELITAWGFTYKTVAFTWVKRSKTGEAEHLGNGYWTRANPEMCLLATRGKPERLNADVRQLLVANVMEHSRKPDEAYERIERLVAGPYLELFARRPREHWVSWGNELPFVKPGEELPYDPNTGEIMDERFTVPSAAPADGNMNGHAIVQQDDEPEEETPPAQPQEPAVLQAASDGLEIPGFLRRFS